MQGPNKTDPMKIGMDSKKGEDKSGDKSVFIGTFIVLALGLICCGGPLILGAISLSATGVASTLGVAWPLAAGLGILLLLALIGLRIYLRQRRGTRTSSSAAIPQPVMTESSNKQFGSDLDCCSPNQLKKQAGDNPAAQAQESLDITTLSK